MKNIFSYIDWPQGYDGASLKTDILAGLTVALVLIPQSMAYAEIAGLPPYYGLYASFLPPMVAALFGSSRQLATGPVAVVSLLTATTLEPLATAGSQQYIAYALLLALLVGVFLVYNAMTFAVRGSFKITPRSPTKCPGPRRTLGLPWGITSQTPFRIKKKRSQGSPGFINSRPVGT